MPENCSKRASSLVARTLKNCHISIYLYTGTKNLKRHAVIDVRKARQNTDVIVCDLGVAFSFSFFSAKMCCSVAVKQ